MELLNSARIATGKLTMELRPVNLGRVIREAASALQPTADVRTPKCTSTYGINAELVPSIFSRFRQGDPIRTRRLGGLATIKALSKR